MKHHVLLLATAILATGPLAIGDAFGKPKVVITKIDGDDGDAVFAAVTEAIEEEVNVVRQKELHKATNKLTLSDDWTDKEVGQVEKAVDATNLIRGTLDKQGEKLMALHLKVYTKGTKKPKAFTVKFSNPKSEKFKKSLHDTLTAKLNIDAGEETPAEETPAEETPPPKPPKGKGKKPKKPVEETPAEETPAPEETPPPKPPKGKGKKPKKPVEETPPVETPAETPTPEETPVEKPKHPKKPVETGAAEEGGGEEGGEVSVSVKGKKGGNVGVTEPLHTANRDALRLDVGMSVTGRRLTFKSRAFDQAPKPFTNAPVPGGRLEGDVYPLAFKSPKSPLAGLGIGFEYDQTFALQLRTLDPVDMSVIAANAVQRHVEYGLRYRLVFGQTATAPSITFKADYGTRRFIVKRDTLAMPTDIDIPDIRYKNFLPGLEARIPVTKMIAFELGGNVALVKDAGGIQAQDSYGPAKVTGGQGNAGLEIVLKNRYVIQIKGELALYGFAFNGQGEQTKGRDGDPTTPDVGGAQDRYLGGSATFAFTY